MCGENMNPTSIVDSVQIHSTSPPLQLETIAPPIGICMEHIPSQSKPDNQLQSISPTIAPIQAAQVQSQITEQVTIHQCPPLQLSPRNVILQQSHQRKRPASPSEVYKNDEKAAKQETVTSVTELDTYMSILEFDTVSLSLTAILETFDSLISPTINYISGNEHLIRLDVTRNVVKQFALASLNSNSIADPSQLAYSIFTQLHLVLP